MASPHVKLNAGARAGADQVERHLAALERAYQRALRAAGFRAARAFQAASHTASVAAAADPKWTPPPVGQVFDSQQLADDTEQKTAKLHRTILETAGSAALEPFGIAFDVAAPVPQALLAQVGQRVQDGIAAAIQAQIIDAIQTGYKEGHSVPAVAAAIRTATSEIAKPRAQMLARTDLNALANGGSLAAASLAGAALFKTWTSASDERVRDTHAEADGQTVPLDAPFTVGGEEAQFPGSPELSDDEACNCRCQAPWTPISGARLATAMRRSFEGDLWRITTAGGREISVTANHPILTRSGWKSAQELRPDDDLVCEVKRDRKPGGPHIEDVPASAEQIFASLVLASSGVKRVPSYRVNFHGDRTDRDVDIATADNPLALERDAALGQEFAELAFSLAHREVSLDCNPSALTRILEPDISGVASITGLTPAFGEDQENRAALDAVLTMQREDTHSRVEVGDHRRDDGLVLTPARQALRLPDEPSSAAESLDIGVDLHGGDAIAIRDLLVRLAGRVEIDPVVEVGKIAFRGHVYNFETTGGVYFADGIASANCTITYTDSLAAAAPPVPAPALTSDGAARALLAELSESRAAAARAQERTFDMIGRMLEASAAPQQTPAVHVYVPEQPPSVVNVTIPEREVIVNVPEPTAPVVHVATAAAPDVHVHVPEPPVPVVAAAPAPITAVRVEIDKRGHKTYIPVRES